MNPSALDALRDIHLPPPPSWWAMPALWAVAACVLVVAAWLLHRRLRHPLLRRSLRELSSLDAAYARDGDAVRLAREVSSLLRRHAAACFPDAGVDGLVGGAWLAFLDAHGGTTAFTEGAGAALESLPYRACGHADGHALVAAVHRWLQENRR